MAIVAWLALWSFGDEVSGGDLVVVGGRGDRGCGDGGMVGVGGVVGGGCDRGCGDGGMVGIGGVVGGGCDRGCSQNNDRKRKTYLKGSQPCEHEEFPLNNGGEIYLNINLAA